MRNKTDIHKNGSGYPDPTAAEAIKRVDGIVTIEESDRFFNLLDTIRYITELAGFELVDHVVLRDTRTGKVWR